MVKYKCPDCRWNELNPSIKEHWNYCPDCGAEVEIEADFDSLDNKRTKTDEYTGS